MHCFSVFDSIYYVLFNRVFTQPGYRTFWHLTIRQDKRLDVVITLVDDIIVIRLCELGRIKPVSSLMLYCSLGFESGPDDVL